MANSTGSPIRVVVADDHPLVRAGVAATLSESQDYSVVGQATNSREALVLIREHRAHLLILDLHMEDFQPLVLINDCFQQDPDLKILILSSRSHPSDLERLEASGIHGFVTKEEGPQSLLQAVRVVLDGQRWFSHQVLQNLQALREQARLSPLPSLSPRERQVLVELVRAKDNQAIADLLQLSKNSVRRYVTQIFQKLGVKNRMEAILWVNQNGMPH